MKLDHLPLKILLVSLFIIFSCSNTATTHFIIIQEGVQEEVIEITFDTVHIERATTYNAVASQCDNNPLNTADGTLINLEKLKAQQIRWVALSRDLIYDEPRQKLFSDQSHWRGPFAFGDTIQVLSETHPTLNGEWILHDCMNKRYSNSMDFLFDPANNVPKLGIGTDIKLIIQN